MSFNFQSFIAVLRNNEEKNKMVEKYEKFLGPITGEIKDQVWYKEYLIRFSSVPYRVPAKYQAQFDWDLLLKLVSASFSSECVLEKPQEGENGPVGVRDLIISVKAGDQSVTRRAVELSEGQIGKLYEIYVEEQMNLQILMKEDEKEKTAITGQREAREQRWKLLLESLNREELEKQAAVEKESKLSDLYSQL